MNYNITNLDSEMSHTQIKDNVGDRRNLTLYFQNHQKVFPTFKGNVTEIAKSILESIRISGAFELLPEILLQESEDVLMIVYVFNDADTLVDTERIIKAASKSCDSIKTAFQTIAMATTIQTLATDINEEVA